MEKPFEGKVAVVTGANSGIGEMTAALLQEAGATVYGVARKKETADAAKKRHPAIRWLIADVTSAEAIGEAIRGAVKETGRLDVLVNNAAIFALAPLEGTTEAMVRGQFETNVFGLTFATQAALPALKASKGTILNISSTVGHKAAPGAAHYGATKASVESLTRSWALELAPAGVRVNALAPGPTETPGFEKAGLPPEAVPQVKAAFIKQVPLGRMATTAEVARWVVSLTDPGVTWITGQVFSVDGGMSLT